MIQVRDGGEKQKIHDDFAPVSNLKRPKRR